MTPSRLRTTAALALCGASLAACASPRMALETTPEPVRTQHHAAAAPRPHRNEESAPSGLRGTMKPYEVNGVRYVPHDQPDYDEVGWASWYGQQFHNRSTADGELFDMGIVTGAHKTLPLPSLVEVTNLDNGRRITLRINDRGPFVGDRILDVSAAGAKELGFYDKGLAHVRVRYIGPADGISPNEGRRYVATTPRPVPSIAVPPLQPLSQTYGGSAPRQAAALLAGQRIQAGAFSTRERAQAAADRLSEAGAPQVQAVERGATTLYRVTVACRPGDDPQNVRARIAAAGFPDARILPPTL